MVHNIEPVEVKSNAGEINSKICSKWKLGQVFVKIWWSIAEQ